jgi:hypothetical protein
MRAFLVIAACGAALLAACQDAASSNAQRETHMGDVRAASTAPPVESAPSAASPAPAASPAGSAR